MMNRKELLIRQNEGRIEIDNYISKLVTILNISIHKSDLIDLETTDELKRKFYETFNTSPKLFSKTYNDEKGTLNNDIELIKPWFIDQEAYLITKISEICGAVKIPAIIALNNYQSIIELDGDSLNLISTNYLHLDYYEEYGKFFYQLSVW